MDLGDIEMIAYAKLGEDVLMHMEQTQAVLHHFESLVHVLLELRIGDEVCQDRFFTDLISTRGLGVRGWSSGKTEMLRSVVVLPE